jgi:hypothetical protein
MECQANRAGGGAFILEFPPQNELEVIHRMQYLNRPEMKRRCFQFAAATASRPSFLSGRAWCVPTALAFISQLGLSLTQ